MPTFEITWSMFGSATVEADTEQEAVNLASSELINWSGFGVDLEEVAVDGVDINP